MTVWGGAVGVRLLVWCGVGGVAFMFLTSVFGIIAGAVAPNDWGSTPTATTRFSNEKVKIVEVSLRIAKCWTESLTAEDLANDSDTPDGIGRLIVLLLALEERSNGRSLLVDPMYSFAADGSAWTWEFATGFPIRAWQGRSLLESTPEGTRVQLSSLWVFTVPTRPNLTRVIVPYQPYWPGMILNSLVGAIGIWVLVVLPAAVRRARRRRRGLCAACGYDLAGVGGGVCPECGGGKGTLRVKDSSWA